MAAPVTLTAEELVVHAFVVMDSVTGDRPYEVVLRLWRSLRPVMGHPVPGTGLSPVPPPHAADLPDELAGESVLAVAQSGSGNAQAVLRRRHDVVSLSALFTGEPGGWREFERTWDLVVDEVADSLLGEVRVYYGIVDDAAAVRDGLLRATGDLASSVGERLPPVVCADGWERSGITTETGFPLWELSPREDGRRLRRLLTLTPATRDSELSSWVWSDKGPNTPRLARYLEHAAKVRHQVRLWNGGRDLRELHARTTGTVAGLRGGVPAPGSDRLRAVELDVASTLAAVDTMRRTVEIAADNMARAVAEVVVTSGAGRNMFTDDRSLAADLGTWLADGAEYLRVDRDLLRDLREITATSRGSAPRATSSSGEPLVGLLTAMPVEFQAMRSLLTAREEAIAPFDHAHYVRGLLPSHDPDRPHRVVLAQTGATANNAAAEGATNLVRSFPSVSCLIMTGVAAGIPAPADPRRHVRLGDVVVATWGIVDYAHVVVREGGVSSRRATFPRPWPYLTRVADRLEVSEMDGVRPWEEWLDAADPMFRRPPEATDRLARAEGQVRHPSRTASGHRHGRPKVHKGLVGSADISVRDAALRDRLAAEHAILALEMEGAGVGTSAFLNDRHWFIVRGISDYADSTYTFRWRPYAALAAAAYVRALLAAARPFDRL